MSTIKVIQNKQRVTKEGCAPLYISFYLKREKLIIPCRISVPLNKFDGEKGIVKGTSKEAKDQNLIISKIKSSINDILVRYRLRDVSLNKEAFIREYNNPSDFKSFHDFVKSYQRIKAREIEISTYNHHKSCMKKFEEYCPGIQFHELTEERIKEYYFYMRKKLGNADSTANRNLSTIKIYTSEAVKKGYLENDPFDSYKIKRIKSNVDYLNENELMALVDLYYKNPLCSRLQKTLQFFLFMCFTSLHISDAKAVKMEDINSQVLTYFRIKNRNSKPEPIKIPLSLPALHIIKEAQGNRKEGYLFTELNCDQVINRQIKEICEILKINKKISSKTGRHTFATIFLRKTKDVATLQKLLGHSNLKETMIYAHVMEESKQEGILIFNTFTIKENNPIQLFG